MEKIKFIKSFLIYLCKAKYIHGHGIHSPFAYDLISNRFEERNPYYVYDTIERARKELLKSKASIYVSDFGTGSSRQRKVADIAKRSLKSKKYAQLLFRLAHQAKPESIIELGTSLGITTAYLASVNTQTPCYSFEGCPQTLAVAKSVLEACNIKHVSLELGAIDEKLPILLNKLNRVGFVFFDANHTKEATLKYFNWCLEKVSNESVFVFDDIHYSAGMEEAWSEIIENKKVRVSFDLYVLGIVYFNPELQKQDYICLF
jgi:predicted O-methyltransferase YrrM